MRRTLLLVLALAALGQTYFGVHAQMQNLRELPHVAARFRPRSFRSPGDELDVQPYLALNELAASIEPDARVLVLSDRLAPFPIEFHLLPRRVSLLAKFDEGVSDSYASWAAVFLAAQLPASTRSLEMNRDVARERYEKLEREGQRFTEARLRERMAQTDYVLVYGSSRTHIDVSNAHVSFDLGAFRLREVKRLSPWVVLYRREGG